MNDLFMLLLLPFISSLLLFALPKMFEKAIPHISFFLSLLPLLFLVAGGSNWIDKEFNYPWIQALSIHFHLKVDPLSLLFLYLIAIIIPISVLAEIKYSRSFYALILLLQGLLIGFFTVRDLAVFTLFWEAMLLPLYFLINLWGGSNRQMAALKFLIYMLAGSFLMIAAVLFLFLAGDSFNLNQLSKISDTLPYSTFLAIIFMLAFAVKVPLFPFHAWLPDAYYEASTTGSILLSAILSKAGIYGILRVSIELFPTFLKEWGGLLIALAIIGVLYGGLAAWMQKDFKRLIAYSSFSHVNFILVGLFVWNDVAHTGAVLQALNHGVTITGLFLASDWLEKRLGTTRIDQSSGLAKYLPVLCWTTFIFVLSAIALPSTNTFVGEIMILYGLFGLHPWWTAFLGTSIILSVVYMLRWMQKVYFETPSPYQNAWVDIKSREWMITVPLIILIFWIGIYPAPILKILKPEQVVEVSS